MRECLSCGLDLGEVTLSCPLCGYLNPKSLAEFRRTVTLVDVDSRYL